MNAIETRCPRCGMQRVDEAVSAPCLRCVAEVALAELQAPAERPGDAMGSPIPILARLGTYSLFEEIARGGMGVVYRARQAGLQRDVAVKVVLAGPFAGREALARFRTEAQAAARLRHPHIVTVHEVGEVGGHHWLSMDFVAGPTLAAMTKEGPLPARQAARYLRKVADAVEHAHRQGIIHRDLKPGNVMIDADDEPRVTDFGLAKQLDRDESLTLSGQALGTPGFAAPEQLSAKRGRVDGRSDVYGLGALLYHLLVGRPPFLAGSLADTVDQVVHHDPVGPRTLNPAVPRELETICLKCLAKEPGRRYATAREVSEEVGRWLDGKPIQARPSPSWERVAHWARRRPGLAGLIAAVAVLCATVSVVSTVASARLARANRESENRRHLLEQFSERQALQLAEASFARQAAPDGLARLAQVLRQNPSNSIAAQRVMSALTHRLYLLPVTAPLPHDDLVHRLRFSPDGRHLATASADGNVRIWNARDQETRPGVASEGDSVGAVSQPRPIHVLRHARAVWWLEYSRDGRRLGTACADLTSRVWDPLSGQPLTPPLQTVDPDTLPPIGLGRIAPFADIRGLTCFTFSPDDQSFAVAGRHRRAELWAFDGRTPARLQGVFTHSNHVFSVSFSPDGRRLATGGFDRRACVWEIATGRKLLDLPHVDRVFWVEFSPDGSKLVTTERRNSARLWDARSGVLLQDLRHRMEVTFAHFSGDGQKLVTVSEDATVRVWDTASGAELFFQQEPARVTEARFSPDGDLVASVSEDQFVRLYDLRSKQPFAHPGRHAAAVLDVVFSPDGRFLATASLDHTARIWQVPQRLVQLRFEHQGYVSSTKLTRDGRRLLTASVDTTAAIWEVDSGRRLHTFQHAGAILGVEFNADETRIVTASADGTAQIWNADDGTPVGDPIRHRDPVESAIFSPDGQWVLTASNDGRTRMTRITTHEERVLVGVEKDVRWASFSPDGTTIVTAAEENVARLWDASTGLPIGDPMAHSYWVMRALFSPDGRRVATACKDGTLGLWGSRTGRPLCTPPRHESGIRDLRFSPDGRFVGTASSDRTGRVWDATTGLPIAESLRHQGDVTSIAFDPASLRIATASLDRTARLWDVASGMPVTEPLEHGGRLSQIEFSQDGRRVVSGGRDDDTSAKVWDVPQPPVPVPDWLPDLVEAIAGGRMAPDNFVKTGPVPSVRDLRWRADARPSPDFYRLWVDWFFDPGKPGSRAPFRGD